MMKSFKLGGAKYDIFKGGKKWEIVGGEILLLKRQHVQRKLSRYISSQSIDGIIRYVFRRENIHNSWRIASEKLSVLGKSGRLISISRVQNATEC